MTVTTTGRSVTYLGNGATSAWPFAFRVLQKSDLVVTVIVDDTETTVPQSSFTVSALPADSGTVTYPLTGSLASGTHIRVERVVSLKQETQFDNQGGYFAKSIEAGLDRVVMAQQQQQATLDTIIADGVANLPAGEFWSELFLADSDLDVRQALGVSLSKARDLFDFIPEAYHAGLIAGTETADMTAYVLAWNAAGVAGSALTAPKCTIYVGAQTIITAPYIYWPNTTIKPVAGAYSAATTYRGRWGTFDTNTGVANAYAVGDAVGLTSTPETIENGITANARTYICTTAHTPTAANYPGAVGAPWAQMGTVGDPYLIFLLYQGIANMKHVGPVVSVDPNLYPHVFSGYFNGCSGDVWQYQAPLAGASGIYAANCTDFRTHGARVGDNTTGGVRHIGATQRNSCSLSPVVITTMGIGNGVQILGGTKCQILDFYTQGSGAFGAHVAGLAGSTNTGHVARGVSYNSHVESANFTGPVERCEIDIKGTWDNGISTDFGSSYDGDPGDITDCKMTVDVTGAAYSGCCLTTASNLVNVIKRPIVRGRIRDCAARFIQGTAVALTTTVNDTLTGLAARDGITPVGGDRVLVKNQTTLAQNGIYIAAAGAWARSTDADTWTELVGLTVQVTAGTINAGKWFSCRARPGGVLGTSNINWDSSRESGIWAPGGVKDGDFDVEVIDTRTPARHAYNVNFADLGYQVASNNKVRLATESGGYYVAHSYRSTGSNSITDLRIRNTAVVPVPTAGAFTTVSASWAWWYEGDGIRVSNLEVAITAVGTGTGPIKVPPPVTPVEGKGFLIGQVYSGTGVNKLIKGSMRSGFASLNFVDGADPAANAIFEVAGTYQAA